MDIIRAERIEDMKDMYPSYVQSSRIQSLSMITSNNFCAQLCYLVFHTIYAYNLLNLLAKQYYRVEDV